MNIDYQYLRPEKAKALKKWYDDPIEVREPPAIWQGSNATILPLRRGFGLLFGKGGVVVAQTDELLERTHVLADVDELETGIARSGLFHFAAVGACLHHIYFNHGVKCV